MILTSLNLLPYLALGVCIGLILGCALALALAGAAFVVVRDTLTLLTIARED